MVFSFTGIWSYWDLVLLGFGLIGIRSYWYLVVLVFGLIGVSSYGLGGFSKETHKFHVVGSPPEGIFEKKDISKTKNVTF